MSQTMTKRNLPKAADAAVPMLDLGSVVVPKGTKVRARLLSGQQVTGTLCAVDMRDGVPFTASVWTGQAIRSTYVENVTVDGAE